MRHTIVGTFGVILGAMSGVLVAGAQIPAMPINLRILNASGGTGGVWTNVTPPGLNLTTNIGSCINAGPNVVVYDPSNPGTFYSQFTCQGIWKSTDYGQTWTGPISPMTGGLSIAPGPNGTPPVLYDGSIGGFVTGFWRSLDGGLTWKNYNIAPLASGRQDVYSPAVDPYDGNHLIMCGHEQDALVQSTDGGQTWTNVVLNPGMDENGGTGFIFFINTGVASTTRTTWLWSAQGTGGVIGTWRTADGGNSWTRVDSNEHPHGNMQIFQPDTSGVVFMGGIYSALGWGVLRSTDYGQTWTHVGAATNSGTVFGTPNNVYSMYGPGGVDPIYEQAPMPGITGWVSGDPPGMTVGAPMAAVAYNGLSWVIVTANWTAGLWRYVE